LIADFRVFFEQCPDLQAIRQPDQEIATGHQPTHQGKFGRPIDVAAQGFERGTPMVLTKITESCI
jgi:hypothetical protein